MKPKIRYGTLGKLRNVKKPATDQQVSMPLLDPSTSQELKLNTHDLLLLTITTERIEKVLTWSVSSAILPHKDMADLCAP